jgi:CRISPR/Cas system CMR-associated protein Cmr1 (group 7 of RAMP superfamily)
MNWQKNIEVLTPLFNRGAFQNTPEIRVPSIRGMVHWWFRKLGGSPAEEKRVFGGMNRFAEREVPGTVASQVIFRLIQVDAKKSQQDLATLPHKANPGHRSPKTAFSAGAKFTLQVINRFGKLDASQEEKLRRALEVWTLLGSLGLRANRAGGSLWPMKDAPRNPQELAQRLQSLGCNWPVYLAGTEVGNTWEQLQKAATDTCSAPESVFGKVKGGRLSSPLKIKVVRLDGALRLLVTAPSDQIIQSAIQALKNKPEAALSQPAGWQKIHP